MKTSICILILTLMTQTALAKDYTYKIDGSAYEGFYINKGKSAPTVILVHDWDGLTDYEKKRSDMLAQLGYSVFAVDLFGKGIRPEKIEDRKQHTGELYKDRNKLRKLMQGGVDAAKAVGLNTSKVLVMGYCFGGAAVLEHARAGGKAQAFVTFHGGLQTPEGQDYKNAKGQFLIFHGSSDDAIPMSEFAKLAEELEKYKLPHEMTTYGNTPHAFTVFGSDRYRKDADKKSWARLTSFLKEVF